MERVRIRLEGRQGGFPRKRAGHGQPLRPQRNGGWLNGLSTPDCVMAGFPARLCLEVRGMDDIAENRLLVVCVDVCVSKLLGGQTQSKLSHELPLDMRQVTSPCGNKGRHVIRHKSCPCLFIDPMTFQNPRS